MTALDLVLTHARIADVFRLRVVEGWCGVRDGRFAYVEAGEPPARLDARKVRDLEGRCLVPGLIDAHMHVESSLLTPRGFAMAALPHGTTTILADPHEVANVAGEEGIRWMIDAAAGLPLRIYHAIPSSVPATSPELEWTAARIDAEAIARLATEPAILALGEVMDCRAVLDGDESLRARVAAAKEAGLLVEGHAPSLSGMALSEYLEWGILSDHTQADPAKLEEQISKGLAVMLQAKSCRSDVMGAVVALPDRSRILLVTDDVEPSLLRQGHLSTIVRLAIQAGLPAVEALAAATIRPARYLGLRDRGGIAPGFAADFLILDDVAAFPPREVWVEGKQVASHGRLGVGLPTTPHPPAAHPVPGPIGPEQFRLVECGESIKVVANAVRVLNEANSLTDLERVPLQVKHGYAQLSEGDRAALVAVFARDLSSHAVGVVLDLGLKAGAYASSFAHDSHNLLVVGRDIPAMCLAANAVYRLGGGVAVAREGRIAAALPLPVMGILSDAPPAEVARDLGGVEAALRDLGVRHQRPFLLLSLLALSVSPRFKFSDKGVVDVEARRLLPSWEPEATR
jgi:adenine deaminase